MAARLTANSFRDLIERSGLIKPGQLEQLFDQFESEGLDLDSPKAIAKALVEKDELTSWQADFLLQGKHKGFFIGPYRLLRLLGKGGMGAVYLAEHQMMKRQCAVKVLPSRHVGENSSVLERFYVEAQAVAALDDPNIVRAYDVNKEMQGRTEINYLVMEYIEGDDLQNFVDKKRGGVDYVEAVDFTRQAANGLAHAHASGLIHRDIKPANLLLDSKGVVKILDLGLARFFDDGEEASLTKDYNDSTLGTADYLSPEQALNSHEVDTRTDIYSLGCTMYFMLTGQPPFPEGTVAQRLLAHQVKSPTPISKFRKDVPDDLLSIVDRMIAKKADDRFQTAAEVAEAAAIWLAEHANDEWKEQHPEVVGMGADAARREPTRAIKSAAEDTEMELGFAEDEPEATPSPAKSSAPQPRPVSADEKADSPATVPTKDLDSLPDVGDPLGELDVASLEAMPAETDILSELPSADSSVGGAAQDPLAAAPGMAPDISQSGILTQSGVISGSSSNVLSRQQLAGTTQAAPAANTTAQSDDEEKSPWKILLPIIIGVGMLVPVVLIVLMLTGGSEDEPTSTASNNPGSGAGPEATGKTDSQVSGGSQKTESASPITDPDKKTGRKTQQPPKEVRLNNNPPDPGGGTVAVVDPPKPDDRPKKTDEEPYKPPKDKPLVDKPPKDKPPVDTPPDNPPEDDPPAEDPAEKARQLFAGIKEVSLKLDSVVPPQHLVYVNIVRMAGDATEAAGLNARSDDKGDALLHVALTAENDEGFALLKLTAEVKCPDESKKDGVTVWKQEKEIGKLAPQLLKQVRTSQILSIRKEIEDFFEQFKLDYKAAVAANAGQ